jgi:hypothetical protein
MGAVLPQSLAQHCGLVAGHCRRDSRPRSGGGERRWRETADGLFLAVASGGYEPSVVCVQQRIWLLLRQRLRG